MAPDFTITVTEARVVEHDEIGVPTTNVAQPGDVMVTLSDGSRYAMKRDRFMALVPDAELNEDRTAFVLRSSVTDLEPDLDEPESPTDPVTEPLTEPVSPTEDPDAVIEPLPAPETTDPASEPGEPPAEQPTV